MSAYQDELIDTIDNLVSRLEEAQTLINQLESPHVNYARHRTLDDDVERWEAKVKESVEDAIQIKRVPR